MISKLIGILDRYKKPLITLFILCTIIILFGTLYPVDARLPESVWEFDKLAHMLMFFIWTILYGLSLRFFQKGTPSLLLITVTSAAFGLMIEVLQYIIPAGRQAELFDFIADFIGTLLAVFLLKMLFNSAKQEKGISHKDAIAS